MQQRAFRASFLLRSPDLPRRVSLRAGTQNPNVVHGFLLGARSRWPGRSAEEMQAAAKGAPAGWYPGHIAKAKKKLQEQIRLVDAIVHVRDARAPSATAHGELDKWAGSTRSVVSVLSMVDLVSRRDALRWQSHIENSEGYPCLLINCKSGHGINALADSLLQNSTASSANARRQRKGLTPRATRAAVVGFPNTGKSALVNRLLGRRANDSAPKPGITQQLRWAKSARTSQLEVLDSPGILPPRVDDPHAAVKLAACNDIGEAAYVSSTIASELAEILPFSAFRYRYGDDVVGDAESGEDVVSLLAAARFGSKIEQAGARILGDFQRGRLGKHCLDDIIEQPLSKFRKNSSKRENGKNSATC